MEQIGTVISTDGKTATVRFRRATSCGDNCAMCGGCEVTDKTAVVTNDINAKAGDNVKMETDTTVVLTAAFFVYIVPLLAGIIAYFNFGALWGILCFFLPFVIIFLLNSKLKKLVNIRITKIIAK